MADTGQQPAGRDPSEVREEARERTAISAEIVHQAIRKEGEEELGRTSAALAWSGLAAGLSMGFSLAAEGLLRSHLPETDWRPLIAKLGYSIGFLIVILGRQQLFTENTLTPVLPLLHGRCTPGNVLRLWGIVLVTNMAGALLFALAAAFTTAFPPEARAAFEQIARENIHGGFADVLVRAIFAGWLIALIVWLQPGAESARVPVIILLTYVIGIGGFAHVIAGAVDAFYGALTGAVAWRAATLGFLAPALIGNVLGGVSLVTLLNHAQVAADQPNEGSADESRS